MTRTIALILLYVLVASSAWTAGGRKSVSIVPANGKPITLVIAGKEKEYYLLGKKTPLRFHVDGPGKLVVMSRLKLSASNTGIEKYTLLLKEGSSILKSQTTQADKSDATFKGTDGVPAKSRKFVVPVPEGSFTYDLWLDDSALEAAVKLQLQPAKGQKLIALEPLSYDRIVTANIKENRVVYYVGSKARPVQLRVVGPATLTVAVRLNYDVTMKGKQKYSVVIQEGAQLVKQAPLIATKSTGLSYEEWKDVVPGKSSDVMLTVPKGEHIYKFSLGESAGQSISLRFSIPKKALANE